jgi:carboxyl-terminal processing protease
VAEFFKARLYTGSDARFPADRWSGMEDKAGFDRFFGDGRTLGYGLFLAGLEISGQPDQPLKVRYVEPRSAAAAQGVQRGDEVVSANGRAARDIVAADDFGVFTPASEGQTLALVLRRDGATRNVQLRASVYDLTPVSLGRVLQSPQGRRMGYLHVKDMISQAEAGLASTFDDFKSAGMQDLVLDLRYNGGGLRGGGRHGWRPTRRATAAPTMVYDFMRCSTTTSATPRSNQDFLFSNPGAWAGPGHGVRAGRRAHLLGQRAGRQRPARRGCQRGADRQHHLRQAGRLQPHRRRARYDMNRCSPAFSPPRIT